MTDTTVRTVVLIEDEKPIRHFMSVAMTHDGWQVCEAETGARGLIEVATRKPDLVIVDLGLPDMDGVEVIRELRGWCDRPVLVLSARSQESEKVAALDAGADDFVAKPIKPKVLISRINAILRRKSGESKSYSEGLVINRERYHVELNGQVIQLPRKEFELLALLASKPGSVFEREVILDSVWGSEIVVGDRTIDVHIRKLREKIGDDYFKTTKGVGYKFEV